MKNRKNKLVNNLLKIQNEFQSLFQKYQVQPTPDQPQAEASEGEKPADGEVIDAD